MGPETAILLDVTSAVENPGMAAPQRVATLNRPNMVSVGTIVFLSQELMFFAGLFAMYFVSKANSGGEWPPHPTHLNVPWAALITVILVSSSFTAQWGVFAAERGDVFALRRWYALSALLGTVFLAGQAWEYIELVGHGTTIGGSVYGSVFFITTGFHAAHVLAGVLAFVVVLLRTFKSKFTPAQATAAVVVSYYWHFVDVVWIGLWITIYFIQ
ncbi:Cytochrome c oxidase subunit 3 [Corynebacterium urogenitale]|uniref:Cytochrome c oxidase subunit 3 n=1 Tax=Corynebacterium urogenitale TaxID=2487892 RepID=A0A5J6Z9V9_9CORY|nr:Cytochrome c oxidase subunit 3 [Corynebacterium urogenitale]